AGAPLALTLTGLGAKRGIAAESIRPAEARFDMAALRQIARSLAARPYVAQKPLDIVSKIDFDVVQKIKFRPDKALWPAGEGPFPVRFFGLDKFNPLPVKINDSSGSTPHAVTFSPQDFDFGDTGLATELPADAGFSGFRVMNGVEQDTDWRACQGASYFRSSGEH